MVLALEESGAVEAENVTCAENEQICRYSKAMFREIRF
jgi:hypothetical protein